MQLSSARTGKTSRTQKSAATLVATAIVAVVLKFVGIEIPMDVMVPVVASIGGLAIWYLREAVS